MLETKVENASTIPMKEKYRADMKKEIKKLQRLRDFFRQSVNNPAITEQQKLIEARKRIETEMEKFRENEKDYKSKKMTSSAMLDKIEMQGKFKFEDQDEYADFSDDDSNGSGDGSDDAYGETVPDDIGVDKKWLQSFLSEDLKSV